MDTLQELEEKMSMVLSRIVQNEQAVRAGNDAAKENDHLRQELLDLTNKYAKKQGKETKEIYIFRDFPGA